MIKKCPTHSLDNNLVFIKKKIVQGNFYLHFVIIISFALELRRKIIYW